MGAALKTNHPTVVQPSLHLPVGPADPDLDLHPWANVQDYRLSPSLGRGLMPRTGALLVTLAALLLDGVVGWP